VAKATEVNRMASKTVGKEASQGNGSELYFSTYQALLRQRERIDNQIIRLQGKFLKAVSSNKGITKKGVQSIVNPKRAKYVERVKNIRTLSKAIHMAMKSKKKMTMDEILHVIEKRKLYFSNSENFYTMVNNKIHQDKEIHSDGRGVYVYKPSKKRGRKAKGSTAA
jgi:hypothetical protein